MKQSILLANKQQNTPEIFYSIQGEGPQIGKPSIFVRLSSCNLYCVWCDTPYTWNWDSLDHEHNKHQKFNKSEESSTISLEDTAKLIKAFNSTRVIYTGGEPMLQQRRLVELNKILFADNNYTIELETNATIKPSEEFDAQVSLYVCSPKLANAKMPEALRIKNDAMSFFAQSDKAVFKFVVQSQACINEINALIETFNIDRRKVYIMGEASTPNELKAIQHLISELAMQTGFQYSDRLHLSLYGDERGT